VTVWPADDAAVGFLARLEPRQSEDLRARGAIRSFRKGHALFHERGVSDSVVVVLRGRVKISTISDNGRETLLAFRGPGDLLGELSAIDGLPRSATAEAIEAVEALIVPASEFRAFVASNADIAIVLLQTLSRRLRDADRKRVEFGVHDTMGRIASRLVELTADYGQPSDEGVVIDMPLSHEELAAWIGSSREAVTKAVKSLRLAGWIRTDRRRITVVDIEALRRRSA
jgi:CRP/FNR family transcriptional regulator, cyclic AMP receptor protein